MFCCKKFLPTLFGIVTCVCNNIFYIIILFNIIINFFIILLHFTQVNKKSIAPNATKNVPEKCYVSLINISIRPVFNVVSVRNHQPQVVSLPKMVLTIVYPIISVYMVQNVLPVRIMWRVKSSRQWVKLITKSVSHVPNVNIHLNLAVR